MEVRVRYAPSPTGLQHIGGLRTALFNYFFSRSSSGKFLLRIEDTDQSRYDIEAEKDLYETLKWLGLSWDEGPQKGGNYGPYIQSQRSEIYQNYAQKLIESGEAYRCYCSPQRLERIRKIQESNKVPSGYDRHCYYMTQEEREEAEKSGASYVVRLHIPLEGKTSFHDLLLGNITWDNKDISPDPVLIKSDGLPTYHLANVIDDHLMKISHVLRAQEWVSSTPFHVRLYKSFGWESPIFCHLPMVLGSDGQKLSKRHGATSVKQFREDGYLPEALINYVTLLGWSLDDKTEFFSKEDLEKVFNITRLKKSPAIFDYKKLDWFNAHYIRTLSKEKFSFYAEKILKEAGYLSENYGEKLEKAYPLIQERIKTLKEIPILLKFILEDITQWNEDDLLGKKLKREEAISCLKELLISVQGFENRSTEENETLIKEQSVQLGLNFSSLMILLRVAVLGSRISPPLFDSMKILGEVEVMVRLQGCITFLEKKEI